MEKRQRYLVRVWLADRPGALGAVASRFGALRGDVIGLEIIERGGGQAIDDLVVSLPADLPIDFIVREVSAEGDVEIEDIRPMEGTTYDPQLDVLEAAAILLGAETRDDLAAALAEHVCRGVRADWACVTESDGAILGAVGDHPNRRWLASFLSGSPAIGPTDDAADPTADDWPPMDAVWVPLPAAAAALVVGRDGPFRARERQRLAALARIADAWFRRMKERSDWEAFALHPSRDHTDR
ncbi:MAG: hypothetical protein AAF547_12940 [Actinomycetota bacterium]